MHQHRAANKLAEVDLFDKYGALEGAEGILTDHGLFNMMQDNGMCAVLREHDRHDVIKSPTSSLYLTRYPPGLGFSASCSPDGGMHVGKATVKQATSAVTCLARPHCSHTLPRQPRLRTPERTPASSGGDAEDFDRRLPTPCGSEPRLCQRAGGVSLARDQIGGSIIGTRSKSDERASG